MTTVVKVTVRYFASIREAVGFASEAMETPAQTVDQLRDELLARGDSYQLLSRDRSVRSALDEVMCDGSAKLSDGCTIAFFPPVTGG